MNSTRVKNNLDPVASVSFVNLKVAAGAAVTKDAPARPVVDGVPAQVKKELKNEG